MSEAKSGGRITSQVKRGKKEEASKFEQYIDYQEPIRRVASHRVLAMLRGEAEGVLRVGLEMEERQVLAELKSRFVHNASFDFHRELVATVKDCYERLLMPTTQSAALQELKAKADEEAINVFGKNLHELLMAAPAGPRVTIGIDPGFRTGCKVAIVDGTGKFFSSTAIYPTPPKRDVESSAKTLLKLIQQHNVELIAIGNGTASRETVHFVGDLSATTS